MEPSVGPRMLGKSAGKRNRGIAANRKGTQLQPMTCREGARLINHHPSRSQPFGVYCVHPISLVNLFNTLYSQPRVEYRDGPTTYTLAQGSPKRKKRLSISLRSTRQSLQHSNFLAASRSRDILGWDSLAFLFNVLYVHERPTVSKPQFELSH